eukprot:scaffold16235_cov30-Attheya_sp.AAC.2
MQQMQTLQLNWFRSRTGTHHQQHHHQQHHQLEEEDNTNVVNHSHTTIAGAMENANIQARPVRSGKKDTRKKLPKPTNWEGARTACETRKDLK